MGDQLSEKETERLKDFYKDLCGKYELDTQAFDIKSQIDKSISFSENKAIIEDSLRPFSTISTLNAKDIKGILKENEEELREQQEKYSDSFKGVLKGETGLWQVFDGDHRIVGLAGSKNGGKTNNIISLAADFRKKDRKTRIYSFGMPESTHEWLRNAHDIRQISSLRQMRNKKDCILLIDQFEQLRLNDRRNRDEIMDFVSFVHHNNLFVLLSSPNLREFNSVIGGIIEKWLLKTASEDQCINGSQLKAVLQAYKGVRKHLGQVNLPKNQLLVINEDEERVITCDYIPEVDTKKSNRRIF